MVESNRYRVAWPARATETGFVAACTDVSHIQTPGRLLRDLLNGCHSGESLPGIFGIRQMIAGHRVSTRLAQCILQCHLGEEQPTKIQNAHDEEKKKRCDDCKLHKRLGTSRYRRFIHLGYSQQHVLPLLIVT